MERAPLPPNVPWRSGSASPLDMSWAMSDLNSGRTGRDSYVDNNYGPSTYGHTGYLPSSASFQSRSYYYPIPALPPPAAQQWHIQGAFPVTIPSQLPQTTSPRTQPPPATTNRTRPLNLDPADDIMAALREEINDPTSHDLDAAHAPVRPAREKGSSTIFKAISYLAGVKDFKTTLHRQYPETLASVESKLDELGVRRTSRPYGIILCSDGVAGSADYVDFKVKFVVNGGPETRIPGAVPWYTKVYCSRVKGSGVRFRELGKEVIDAARYINNGRALLDHEVPFTWGLY